MCERGDTTLVPVKVVGSHSASGGDTWKVKPIDRCVAPLVEALQGYGIDMLGSCCGHGERPGEILLADGRALGIYPTILDRNHYDWFYPKAADVLDPQWRAETRAQLTGALTDPFVHDAAKVTLAILDAWEAVF